MASSPFTSQPALPQRSHTIQPTTPALVKVEQAVFEVARLAAAAPGACQPALAPQRTQISSRCCLRLRGAGQQAHSLCLLATQVFAGPLRLAAAAQCKCQLRFVAGHVGVWHLRRYAKVVVIKSAGQRRRLPGLVQHCLLLLWGWGWRRRRCTSLLLQLGGGLLEQLVLLRPQPLLLLRCWLGCFGCYSNPRRRKGLLAVAGG